MYPRRLNLYSRHCASRCGDTTSSAEAAVAGLQVSEHTIQDQMEILRIPPASRLCNGSSWSECKAQPPHTASFKTCNDSLDLGISFIKHKSSRRYSDQLEADGTPAAG